MMTRWYLTRLGMLLSVVVACGPSAPAVQSAAERRDALEAQLLQTPPSTEPNAALRRSRLLRALGRQEQALEELNAAVEAARERLSWDALTSLWREIGTIYVEQGQVEKALDVFGKRLQAAVSLDEPAARASALVDTGYAFALLGHVGQADEAVTEAHVLGGDGLMRDPVNVERLGIISDLLNDAAKARFLLEDAAAAHRASGDETSAARAQVLAARIAEKDGETGALARLEAQVAGIRDSEPLALLRRYQAELELLAHNYDDCERHAGEAVQLADGRGLSRVGKIARAIAARCADENGHLADALRHAREAASMAELDLRHVTGDSARQQLAFEAFQIYQIVLALEARQSGPDRVARAFVTSERARARAHLDALARSQLGDMAAQLPISAALLEGRAQAQERIKEVTRALVKGRSRRALKESERNALWALEDINDAIARANPLLSRVTPPDPANLEQVRSRLLDDDSALLSYFSTQDRIYLFAVDKKSESLTVLDTSSEQIGEAVARYRKSALLAPGATRAQIEPLAKKLYAMLLGPAEAQVRGKKKLVVVPHGPLSKLPFESLIDPAGKYLVESHDVVYSVSATVGIALVDKANKRGQAKKAFVGMGDPVYDWAAYEAGRAEGSAVASTRALELWNAADEDNQGGGLTRLPGTSRELQAIAKLFGGDQQLYLRAQAAEEQVKAGALSDYRIVHIASHGLLTPRYQALALTLRPGAKEDGFLLNSEIAELDLKADLVVLSACRTGLAGSVRAGGEEVAGLTLSLRSAGAGQVVLSLWSVDDDATADLMQRFYRPLVSGADYARSLAEAKRQMIADGKWAHPFFWAAFVLHGS